MNHNRRATVVVALVGIAALTACSSASGSTEELCRSVSNGQALPSVFAGFDPTDASAALDQLRTARVDLGELKDAAPAEVSDDLQVEIDYVQALIDSLDALADDADAAQVAATIQSVTNDHPDVGTAATMLQTFATERC